MLEQAVHPKGPGTSAPSEFACSWGPWTLGHTGSHSCCAFSKVRGQQGQGTLAERAHTAPACRSQVGPHSKGSEGWPAHSWLWRKLQVGERSARAT